MQATIERRRFRVMARKSKQQLQVLTKYCSKGHRVQRQVLSISFIILTYNVCCKNMGLLAGLMQDDKLLFSL